MTVPHCLFKIIKEHFENFVPLDLINGNTIDNFTAKTNNLITENVKTVSRFADRRLCGQLNRTGGRGPREKAVGFKIQNKPDIAVEVFTLS